MSTNGHPFAYQPVACERSCSVHDIADREISRLDFRAAVGFFARSVVPFTVCLRSPRRCHGFANLLKQMTELIALCGSTLHR